MIEIIRSYFLKLKAVIIGFYLYFFLLVLYIFSKRKILILFNDYGQLGNRLLLYIHLMQFAEKYNLILLHPSFMDYHMHFSNFQKKHIPSYPKKNLLIPFVSSKNKFYNCIIEMQKIKKNYITFPGVFYFSLPFFEYTDRENNPKDVDTFQNRKFSLDTLPFLKSIESKFIIILEGWRFRMTELDNSESFHDEIKSFFLPNESSCQSVLDKINYYRQTYKTIVGIHHRKKDFRQWLNGKYYFSNEIFCAKINELHLQLLNSDKSNILYLYFSDEPEDKIEIKGLTIEKPSGNIIEDLYMLSLCDYIIGSPSTYSGWASFYGKVPLFWLRNEDDNIVLENFKIIQNWQGVTQKLCNGDDFIL